MRAGTGAGLAWTVLTFVFGLGCLALWDAGHSSWALALLAFSVLVNALAQLPGVRALVGDSTSVSR